MVYVRQPRGSYTIYPFQSLEVAIPEKTSIHWMPSSIRKKARFTSGCSHDAAHSSCDSPSSSRRFALGASNASWSVKTRRTPSRHYKDAGVHGHKTAAMHDMSTPPTPNLRPHGVILFIAPHKRDFPGSMLCPTSAISCLTPVSYTHLTLPTICSV